MKGTPTAARSRKLRPSVGHETDRSEVSVDLWPDVHTGRAKAIPVANGAWHRFEVRQIEQLRNAILGANLDAMQMAGPCLGGRLAYAAANGIIVSTGFIDGKVALYGPVHIDGVTILVNIADRRSTLFLLDRTGAGDIAVLQSGACLDAQYPPGALYFAATLSQRKLAEESSQEGVVLDRRLLKPAGLHMGAIPDEPLEWMKSQLESLHRGEIPDDGEETVLRLVRTAIRHLGVAPSDRENSYERVKIVRRARDHILRNLSSAISMPALAAAAETSQRTLFRAFSEVLDITPHAYLHILRLNRIRQELVSAGEKDLRISMIARRYGIGELGRLSRSYRRLFGEKPSETLTRSQWHRPNGML